MCPSSTTRLHAYVSVFFFSSSRALNVSCSLSVRISSSWVSLYSSLNCSPKRTRSRVASCRGMSLRYRPLLVKSSRFITLFIQRNEVKSVQLVHMTIPTFITVREHNLAISYHSKASQAEEKKIGQLHEECDYILLEI